MRILIVEPHATGHHASYLRWLVQAASARRWQITIATTASSRIHAAIKQILAEFKDVKIVEMPNNPGDSDNPGSAVRFAKREFEYWSRFKRITAQVQRVDRIDFVVLPYIDYCFYAIGLLGSPFGTLPWCGISMRLAMLDSQNYPGPKFTWKWRVAGKILREASLQSLFVINPSVADVPHNWYRGDQFRKLRYLPDPAESCAIVSRGDSRSALGVADGDILILVFGAIDDRKGVAWLVSAMLSDRALDRYVLVLAGEHSSTMREQLSSGGYSTLRSQNRLIVVDRFLDDPERDRLLSATDVIWVGYRNHIYMSGVLVLAGKAGIPVIGTADGEIGRLIRKHEIGMTSTQGDLAETATALSSLIDPRVRQTIGERAKRAFADHTVELFGKAILGTIDPKPAG